MTSSAQTKLFFKVLLLWSLTALNPFAAMAQMAKMPLEYSVPLKFAVLGDGLELGPVEIVYDLESSKGQTLDLGIFKFNEENFFVKLMRADRIDSRLIPALGPTANKEWVFLVRWPDNFVREGTFEMVSRSGRTLWTADLSPKALGEWKSEQLAIEDFMVRNKKISRASIKAWPFFRYQYGVRDILVKPIPLKEAKDPVRFCMSYREDNNYTRMCTAQYILRRTKQGLELLPLRLSLIPPRVIAMSEEGKLAGVIKVEEDKPAQFYAELSGGMTFDFVASFIPLNVVDMVEETGSGWVKLVGEGRPPIVRHRILNPDETNKLVEFFGWQRTIGDQRKYWEARIDLKDPVIYVGGNGGGLFRQRLDIKKIPTEAIRPRLKEKTIDFTYVDGAKIFGRKQPNLSIKSEQNSVETAKGDAADFVWYFGAKKRGEYNRSYLTIGEGDKSYRLYHEVFKGYPREFSTRLSGLVGSGNSTVLMGDLTFNYWFEDIFSWTNYTFSRHRWGTSIKSFQSLNSISINGNAAGLSVLTADLKYRLTPGLWGRDETWGLLLGVQKTDYDVFSATLGGAGFFWARSMPKAYDDFFNGMNIFKYPKWVDLEFIYYLQSFTSTAKLRGSGSGTWSLNFHGKVLLTKTFFGEAGFGVKQYDFTREYTTGAVSRSVFQFTSVYGTMGIGLNF